MPGMFRRRRARHTMVPAAADAAGPVAAPPDTLEGWTEAFDAMLTGLGHDMGWRIAGHAHTGACRSCGGQVVIRRPRGGGPVGAFPAGTVLAGRKGRWHRCKGPR